jgi:hypothetical protein
LDSEKKKKYKEDKKQKRIKDDLRKKNEIKRDKARFIEVDEIR